MDDSPVALGEEDYNAGAHEWLASRAFRIITCVLGAAASAAWLLGVVCSVLSWRDDSVVVPSGVLLAVAVSTGPAALFWLAGTLFRTMRPVGALTSFDPVSRQNRTVNAVLFGIVRPTLWTVAGGLVVVAISAATLVVNARLGAHQMDFRVIDGRHQIRALTTVTWSSASPVEYRAARATDLRSSAAVALLVDTIGMIATVGLLRWGASEASDTLS